MTDTAETESEESSRTLTKGAIELKARRLKAGYTQEFVALQVGVRQATVSRWENGAVPLAEQCIKLEAIFPGLHQIMWVSQSGRKQLAAIRRRG